MTQANREAIQVAKNEGYKMEPHDRYHNEWQFIHPDKYLIVGISATTEEEAWEVAVKEFGYLHSPEAALTFFAYTNAHKTDKQVQP